MEGDVPDRRRLLLDARLSAEHRVPRRRLPVADRDAHPRAADAVRRAAGLPRGSPSSARTARAASAMLEQLLPRWRGKVLRARACSASRRPTSSSPSRCPPPTRRRTSSRTRSCRTGWSTGSAVTLVLLAALGAIFLKGFRRRSGIAVVLVAVYLRLNVVVIGVGLGYICQHPDVIAELAAGAVRRSTAARSMMVGLSLLLFPEARARPVGIRDRRRRDAAGEGRSGDTPRRTPRAASATRRSCCSAAALIMSVLLIGSSFVTTLLIPPAAFEPGGEANGRALAYLAHEHFGDVFGTIYDLSTIAILWFAGASAMAGLLNLVPRYLPRYGMAPGVGAATRPLVLVFTAIAFLVTILFDADVDAQGGAYATGVLVLMTSAAVAVTLFAWRQRARLAAVSGDHARLPLHDRRQHDRAAGRLQIASFFIVTIVLDVAGLARRALDRAAHPRRGAGRGGPDVHRSGRGGRGRPDHREPARPAATSRSTPPSCAKRATRTACARASRCSSSRCGPATPRTSPMLLDVAGRRGRRLPRAAHREPRDAERHRRAPAALRDRTGRCRTPTSAGPKATRSSTC